MPNGENHLTEKQIRFGLWWAKYKFLFRKALVAVLIAVCVLLWGKVFFELSMYAFAVAGGEAGTQRALAQGGIDWPKVLSVGRPVALEWTSPQALAGSRGSDVVVQVQNANPEWLARFHFRAAMGDQSFDGEDFILPGDTKYVFGSFALGRGAPSFSISDVRWQRVDRREAQGDRDGFIASRLDFIFEKTSFLPSAGGLPARVSFEAVNRSAFGFWEPRFVVLLWRGSSLAGIQRVVIDRFASGERRVVEFNLSDQSAAVSRVEVISDVNVFDPASYMPPTGETLNPKL